MVTLVFRSDPLMPDERATSDAVSIEQAENSAVENRAPQTKGCGSLENRAVDRACSGRSNGYRAIKMGLVWACGMFCSTSRFRAVPGEILHLPQQPTSLRVVVPKR